MTTDRPDNFADHPLRSTVFDSLRQLLYPPEIRIVRPADGELAVEGEASPAHSQERSPAATNPPEEARLDRMLADVATCLWYLKTKHFRRPWDSEDRDEDDPRARRALGRLNTGIAALAAGGVEIQDPTNKRYPPGSGDLMKPVQLQPTPGLTVEKVVETVKPIVFRQGRLVQQGEVFVAVPENGQDAGACDRSAAPGAGDHSVVESPSSEPPPSPEQSVPIEVAPRHVEAPVETTAEAERDPV